MSLQKALEKKLDAINSQLYAEKEIWSQQFKGWKRYYIKKPRLPTPADSTLRLINLSVNRPQSLSAFVGRHNDEIMRTLKALVSSFEESKVFPPALCVLGPAGSGKTSLISSFVSELSEEMNLSAGQAAKWITTIDASNIPSDENYDNVWKNLSKFLEPSFERFISCGFRLVVIDNVDHVPSGGQFPLKRLMESTASKARFILIARDQKKVMNAVRDKCQILRTKHVEEKDALMIVLNICHKNRIGYDRDGIKMLLNLHSPQYPLSTMLDILQKTFVSYHFISQENVIRAVGAKTEKIVVPSTRAAEPFTRCKICTLFPPCKHLTTAKLEELALQRRQALPRYEGGMCCPEWARFGRCSIFSKYGHCSLDHPKKLHIVTKPIVRCPLCTIVWPCNHCVYTQGRSVYVTTLESISKKLQLLKKLTVSEVSLTVTMRLDKISSEWRLLLYNLNKIYW